MDAADKYDPNSVSKKTGKKAKFTTFLYWSASTTRFLGRDVLARAASLDAPIKRKKADDGDKQQRLIDIYEDRPQQTALDAYGDTAGAAPGERWKECDTSELAKGLNENQRFVFDNWPMSGKELAASLGVSEPRVSQLRSETIEALMKDQK
jgi:hypothetical protein